MIIRNAIAAVVLWAGLAQAQTTGLEKSLQQGFADGKLDGLHAVLVRQNGKTLAELYFDGPDERWGQPLGPRSHGADTMHDLRSVSKSIVGLLYGIALDKGLVPPPDASVMEQFPDHADLSTAQRDRITIADTLSMQMGIAWDETLPYTDPRNSEIAMELAEDRHRFVLQQPMATEPGRTWVYSGGATAILAAIIQRGTGMPIDEFADRHLFGPLGITRYEWIAGADGIPSAASGLRMTARGLARIGEMVAAGGTYDGQQVVPADWLSASFVPRAAPAPLRYGFHWWLSPVGDPPNWVAGLGNGGQRMSISPRLGLVVVVFAGRYNQPDAWQLPVSVVNDHIAPALGLR